MFNRPSGTSIVTLVIGCITVLALGGLLYWLRPPTTDTVKDAHNNSPTNTASSAPEVQQSAPSKTPTVNTTNITANAVSASQQDVSVNCQLQLKQQHLIVNRYTKDCYEFFITQYGEKDLPRIDQDFQTYITTHYPLPANQEIIGLWRRYKAYRHALGQIAPVPTDNLSHPNSNNPTPNVAYFRAIEQSQQNLRQQFFSIAEIHGLFGDENTYKEYTLARLAILEDASLSENEKAGKLNALFDTLPANWQADIRQIQTLDNLHRLTADIKARNGSRDEIHQMRVNLVGAAAAGRLEVLDKARLDWQTQVTEYLTARDQVLHSQASEAIKQASIEQLRRQKFPQASDSLRLQTFEALHDQGQALPFNK